MKKQDIAGIVVYVLILAFAAIFGLAVIRDYSAKSGMETGIFILFVCGAIMTGVIVNSTLYEIAHIFGAKIGGYNITMVAVLGLTFVKENNKIKFRFGSYDGLTGETKIVPKKNRKKESNPIPYLIMGTLLYAVEAIAVVFAFSLLTRDSNPVELHNLGYFLLIVMAVGGVIVFYNIIPIKLDSMNDGYRLRLVSGKKNRKAFNAMLLGETSDVTTSEESRETSEVSSSFSSDIKLNQVYVLLNDEKFNEAEPLIDEILASKDSDKKVSNKTLFETRSLKIFLMAINHELDETITYYEKELTMHEKKDLSDDNTLSSLRAYILVAGLLDRSSSEVNRALGKAYKAYKHTPENRRELESKLFNKAVDILIGRFPDWNLEEYKIHTEQ